MNIAHKLEEVFVLIAYDGLVTVLEKVPASAVAQVEGYGIAREKSAHECRQSYRAGTHEKMEVIGKKRPCETDCVGLFQQRGEPLDEIAPVVIVQEDITPFNSANDYMLKQSRHVNASCTWHSVCTIFQYVACRKLTSCLRPLGFPLWG